MDRLINSSTAHLRAAVRNGRSRFYPSFRLVLGRGLVRPFRRRIKLQTLQTRKDDYDREGSGDHQG